MLTAKGGFTFLVNAVTAIFDGFNIFFGGGGGGGGGYVNLICCKRQQCV